MEYVMALVKSSFMFFDHRVNKIHMGQAMIETVKGEPFEVTAHAHEIELTAEVAKTAVIRKLNDGAEDDDISYVGALAVIRGDIVWVVETDRRGA